jgi:hypothetical protein
MGSRYAKKSGVQPLRGMRDADPLNAIRCSLAPPSLNSGVMMLRSYSIDCRGIADESGIERRTLKRLLNGGRGHKIQLIAGARENGM